VALTVIVAFELVALGAKARSMVHDLLVGSLSCSCESLVSIDWRVMMIMIIHSFFHQAETGSQWCHSPCWERQSSKVPDTVNPTTIQYHTVKSPTPSHNPIVLLVFRFQCSRVPCYIIPYRRVTWPSDPRDDRPRLESRESPETPRLSSTWRLLDFQERNPN